MSSQETAERPTEQVFPIHEQVVAVRNLQKDLANKIAKLREEGVEFEEVEPEKWRFRRGDSEYELSDHTYVIDPSLPVQQRIMVLSCANPEGFLPDRLELTVIESISENDPIHGTTPSYQYGLPKLSFKTLRPSDNGGPLVEGTQRTVNLGGDFIRDI